MEDIGHITFGVIKFSEPKARIIGIAIRVNRYRTLCISTHLLLSETSGPFNRSRVWTDFTEKLE